ncbi:MAG TPA: hypothetical protein DEP69_01110, partial [Acidimicrobiaceae bacterium]|nr:hypothetical protein [Acidimicrobiaceae bacterium]
MRSYAGGTLFGSRLGEGAPRVLYLHGWGRTHRDFDEVRRHPLLTGADGDSAAPASLAVDLPGFGVSPAPPTGGGAGLYARLLAPVVAECEQPVLLVGHSFGGRVALELAQQRPAVAAALVLTGVPLLRPLTPRNQPKLSFRLARLGNRVGLVSNGHMETLRRRSGSDDYRNTHGVMRDVLVAAVNETYETQLRSTKIPVELVWGDRDREVPPGVAVRAETMLADARLTLLPGVGHFVPTEAPDDLAECVARVLTRLGPAGDGSAGGDAGAGGAV